MPPPTVSLSIHTTQLTQICVRCGVEKAFAVDSFRVMKKTRYYRVCRLCENERNKKWTVNNWSRFKAYQQAWVESNRDRVRENGRKFYYTDKGQAKWRRFKAVHRERLNDIQRAHYNPDKQKTRKSAYINKNRERARLLARISTAKRRSAIISSERHFTVEDVDRLYIAQDACCANPYCRDSLTSGFDIDHIVPISKNGTNGPDNIQLLCENCNTRKWNKDWLEWLKSEEMRLIGCL